MLSEAIAVTYPMVVVGPFMDVDVAANQTDAQLLVSGTGPDGVVMPRPGWIVGMSINLSAAASAGSMTVGATIDGTENSNTTRTFTTQTSAYAKWSPRDVAPRFSAGQAIGVEITTNSSWNATTADLAVYLFVVLEQWDF